MGADAGLHEVTRTVRLAAPASAVWDVLTRPAEVMAALTDPDSGVRLLSGPAVMAPGTATELEVTGFGLPQRVTYEVAALTPPAGDRPGDAAGTFTEVMARGPLNRFDSVHTVTPLDLGGGTAGCEVTDAFVFAPPGGLLGFVLTADRISNELAAGLRYRHDALRARFGAG